MSNLLTGLKSDVRLDSEEAHYARLVEQYRELEAKVERQDKALAEAAVMVHRERAKVERLERARHTAWCIVHNAQKLGWVSNDYDALEAVLQEGE